MKPTEPEWLSYEEARDAASERARATGKLVSIWVTTEPGEPAKYAIATKGREDEELPGVDGLVCHHYAQPWGGFVWMERTG